jgi:hypothetical protein
MANTFQEGKEKLIGHIETDTGTILLTDGIWNDDIPSANQQRVHLNLGTPQIRIPVYGVIRNSKRYLILDIDRAITNHQDKKSIIKVEETDIPKEEPGPSFEDQEIPFAMHEFPRTPDSESEE